MHSMPQACFTSGRSAFFSSQAARAIAFGGSARTSHQWFASLSRGFAQPGPSQRYGWAIFIAADSPAAESNRPGSRRWQCRARSVSPRTSARPPLVGRFSSRRAPGARGCAREVRLAQGLQTRRRKGLRSIRRRRKARLAPAASRKPRKPDASFLRPLVPAASRSPPIAPVSAAASLSRNANKAASALRYALPSGRLLPRRQALLLLPHIFEQPPRGVIRPRRRLVVRRNEIRVFHRAAFQQRFLLLLRQHRRLSVPKSLRRKRQDFFPLHAFELHAVRKARKHLFELRSALRLQKFLQQPVAPRQDDAAPFAA